MTEPDGFPEHYALFPTLERITEVAAKFGHCIFDHIRHVGLSDHDNHGAAPLLDRELYGTSSDS